MKEPATTASVEFETDHLLSKWGFQDGELLDDVLRSHGYAHMDAEGEEWYHFARRVLCEVVECFVCTTIQNKIKPYRVVTSHNPIRVYEVDGQHVGYGHEVPMLRPSTVAVPVAAILETAGRLYAERHSEEGEVVEYIRPSRDVIRIARERGWGY